MVATHHRVATVSITALALWFCRFIYFSSITAPVAYAGWSFAIAMYSLLTALVTRSSFSLDETLVLVAAWDFATALFAIGLSWCTIRHWQRRAIGASRAMPSIMPTSARIAVSSEPGFSVNRRTACGDLSMRWGPGPVFIYECLANSRRWQTYALRAAGVAGLLCAMATIASSQATTTGQSWRDYAELGQAYFIAMIGVELALVLLAAPAATAGAICLDRARGTLAHMLMTDLSDPEIVLGKLAARLLPVLGLVACTWPVMAISSLLGGIDPIALTLAFAIIIGRRRARLLDGPVVLGVGQEVARSHSGDLHGVYPCHPLLADLVSASDGRVGEPGSGLGVTGKPVLSCVRPVRRSRQVWFLGLSRFFRHDARDVNRR